MEPTFRPSELETLRDGMARPGPSLLVVRGPRGAGATTLVRRALRPETATVAYTASAAADGDHRQLLAARLHREGLLEGVPEPERLDWPDLLEAVRARVDGTRTPLVLVLDDAHHLFAARSRLAEILASFWAGVRAHALPLHLVLAGRSAGALDALATSPPLDGLLGLDLELRPVAFRRALASTAGWPAHQRMLAAAVFGGSAEVLSRLDASASLATNVRRLVLEPDAPFFRYGDEALAGTLQSPARYGSVLRALATGRREWGEVVEAVPEFGSAGQLAPYLARLEALGWIEVERSVDAPPRSRSRRYRVADPFLAFWLRYVPPHRAELEAGDAAGVWTRSVRPDLDRHMALRFPALCREWLLLHGDERLPGRAREAGGLWGPGYDLEVGGTLRTGAACYGRCLWGETPAGAAVVDEIDAAIRGTRYGFGREVRMRLVFCGAGFEPELQRLGAREPTVRLIGVDDLVGRSVMEEDPGR